MKTLEPNKEQSEKESKEAEKKSQELEKREAYLESLKNNKNFNKYVVEGIIKRNLEDLSNVMSVPGDSIEEVGRNTLASQLAVNKLQDILKELT